MHVCLFDIDGTLVDTAGAGRDAMILTLAAEFNIKCDGHGVGFAGRTDRAIVSDLFRLHSIEDNQANWGRFREAFVKQLPVHLERRQGRVLPGVVELLALLSARPDVVLGLLTGNLREGARLKLRHYGLYAHFSLDGAELGAFGDHHHQRDDVAHDALRSVRERHSTGIDVDRVWVIGDTPRDVQCARAIGAKAIAVATGVHSRDQLQRTQPDRLLTNLSDASQLLDLLDA